MVLHRKVPTPCKWRGCVLPHLQPQFPILDPSLRATPVCHCAHWLLLFHIIPTPFCKLPALYQTKTTSVPKPSCLSPVVQSQHLLPDFAWVTLWKVHLFTKLSLHLNNSYFWCTYDFFQTHRKKCEGRWGPRPIMSPVQFSVS